MPHPTGVDRHSTFLQRPLSVSGTLVVTVSWNTSVLLCVALLSMWHIVFPDLSSWSLSSARYCRLPYSMIARSQEGTFPDIRHKWTSAYEAPPSITDANIPLAKASPMVKPSIQGHQYWEARSLRAADVIVRHMGLTHHLERRVRQSHELLVCHQAVPLKETDALELSFLGEYSKWVIFKGVKSV